MLSVRLPQVARDEAAEAAESLGKAAAGAGYVPAHEAFAVRAVHDAGIEPQSGLNEKAAFKLLGKKAKGTAVHPHEVCPFKHVEPEGGQTLGTEVFHEKVVAIDIVKELPKPLRTIAIGGYRGDDTEGIDIADLVVINRTVNALTHLIVGGDDVSYLQPGDVERLAWGDADHGSTPQLIGKRRKRGVWMSGKGKLAMYLVRDDSDPVAQAYLAYAHQLAARPYAPSGVVWIAEEHELHACVSSLTLEVVEIYHIRVTRVYQGTGDGLASVVPYGREETVVDWSLYQHLVSGAGQSLYYGRQGGDNTRSVDNLPAPDGPAVSRGEPRYDGIVVVIRDTGATQRGRTSSEGALSHLYEDVPRRGTISSKS